MHVQKCLNAKVHMHAKMHNGMIFRYFQIRIQRPQASVKVQVARTYAYIHGLYHEYPSHIYL